MTRHEGKSDQGPIRPGKNQQNPQDINNPHPQGYEQQRQEEYRNDPTNQQQQRDWEDSQRNQQSAQRENQNQTGQSASGTNRENNPGHSGSSGTSETSAAHGDTNFTENERNQDPAQNYRNPEEE